MAKQLRQYRYYGESQNNAPQGLSKNMLVTGSAFFAEARLISIASLGIQTLPGVKFYLNDSVDPIIIGHSGIFELSSTNKYEVTSLRFDPTSIDLIDSISNTAYLIVDVIYNTKG